MTRFLNRLASFVVPVFTWVFVALDTLIVFIVIALLKPVDRRERISYKVANFWGKSIVRANPLWKIKVSGRSFIQKNHSYVLVANHTSLADIVCLYCLGKNFKWIAKKSLFRIPFLGWTMSLLNYIPLSRGKHGSIRDSFQEAEECLKKNISVLFFPEGTRSRTGALGEFKNGAFKLAIQCKRPIVPIVLRGTGEALSKGKAAMATKVNGSVKVLAPVETSGYDLSRYEELKRKVWNLMNEELSQA